MSGGRKLHRAFDPTSLRQILGRLCLSGGDFATEELDSYKSQRKVTEVSAAFPSLDVDAQ